MSKEERPAVVAARKAEALRKRETLDAFLARVLGPDRITTVGVVVRRGALDKPVKNPVGKR